ncbi:MAG: CHASE2 domain-containing protein [Armatimonadetes bacterium]|nr:CHASE2 domain-containing protein [Armatimonadota bacterium]
MAKPKRSQPSAKQAPQRASLTVGFVLAVDIVEYSLRPTIEQADVVARLTSLAGKCPTYASALSAGQVTAVPAGDGFVFSFSKDPLSPLRCALELRTLVGRQGGFKVRMAVHIGALDEVDPDIAGGRNMAGEGINNAARALTGCAPGEIVLTQRAVEFLREAPEFSAKFGSIGEVAVKHGEVLHLYRYSDKPNETDPLARYQRRAVALHARALTLSKVPVASVRVIAHRLRDLRYETLAGLALIPVALALHALMEHTDFGRKMRLSGYERLVASVTDGNRSLPVTFVDIEKRFDKPDGATDLNNLKSLLLEVADLEPAAVAIDIDFGAHSVENAPASSDGARELRYLDEAEIVLKTAKQLTDSGIPVYLAVREHLEFQNKDDFLGPGYSDLVVHPLRPDDALNGQVLAIGDITIPGPESGAIGTKSESETGMRIPSLSHALANAYLAQFGETRPVGSPFLERYSEFGDAIRPLRTEDGPSDALKGKVLEGREFLLNTACLSRIKADRIEAQATAPMLRGDRLREKIKGKSVLIGSSKDEFDQFTMPVTGEREYGPYFHAMAVVTETNSPLYEFRPWFASLLAILAGAFVLLVSQVSLRRTIAHSRQVSGSLASNLATAGAVAILLVGGGMLAARWQILWTEYLLVAFLLAFHPTLHQRVLVLIERWAFRSAPGGPRV